MLFESKHAFTRAASVTLWKRQTRHNLVNRYATMTKHRPGSALLVVLVLIVMISLGVYSFAQLMTAQESGTVMAGRRIQAQAAVTAGVEYVKDYLMLPPDQRVEKGGHWDNPSYFQDIEVGGDDQGSTRFSIISIEEDQYGEPIGPRFGLTDESSKLNVNHLVSDTYGSSEAASVSLSADGESMAVVAGADAGGAASEAAGADAEAEGDAGQDLARQALMALPNMTESIADSILDWIDADDEPREFGAEAEVYGFLGYEPRNGPISGLDELLLVQGVTNELLYGSDRNHNGLLEANEQAGGAAVTGGTASMTRGWAAYLTARSQDVVEQADTTIDLNQDDLQALYDELVAADFEQDFAAYAVVYRQNGPYTAEIPEDAPDDFELPVPQTISVDQIDFSKSGETKINSVLDLLGSSSQGSFAVPGKQEPESILVQSPYTDAGQLASILPIMMSQLVAGELGGSAGINTNQCGEAVMAGLPNLESDVVQNMMQLQDRAGTSSDPNYLYPTWPLGLAAVSIEQMKELLPYVAGQGTIFRAQIVGYSDVPGVFARAEVVIDASGEQPRVLSWRDLSHLGLGFSLDTLAQ